MIYLEHFWLEDHLLTSAVVPFFYELALTRCALSKNRKRMHNLAHALFKSLACMVCLNIS